MQNVCFNVLCVGSGQQVRGRGFLRGQTEQKMRKHRKKESLWQRSLRVLFLVGSKREREREDQETHAMFTFTQMDKHPQVSWIQKPLTATYSQPRVF